MNQVESILGFVTGCDLHLWSDATHEIGTEGIKHLVKSVVEQLCLELLRVDAYYYQEWHHWKICFRWRSLQGMRTGLDHVIMLEDIERRRSGEHFNSVAANLSDRISRISSTSNGEPLSAEPEACVVGMETPLSPIRIPTIGDRNCKYNARSQYLRCATNPSGPCDGCTFFELFPTAAPRRPLMAALGRMSGR
ncbi:DUF6464 family protein [Nostoc sp.]|uniref:DUF6464 family protein n=1 Tax=Nostoc sp. TaxID=1180 RepID=UPI003FA5BC4F